MSLRHRRAHQARRIALLSDSHGVVQPALLERLRGADLIVHAGDLGGRSVMRDLKAIGYTRTLSLELFNEELWAKDPKEVSEVGLRKMREGVEKALA